MINGRFGLRPLCKEGVDGKSLGNCKEIALRADAETSGGWVPFSDKRSPSVWNPSADAAMAFAVPTTGVLTEQIALWRRHCEALAKRLRHLSAPNTIALTEHLEAVARGDDVPALVVPGGHMSPRILGTTDLVKWWPDWFGLKGNWSRAYWQTRLVREGVASRNVDLLLRHTQSGTRVMTSTSAESVIGQVRIAARAQAAILAALGCVPVQGLVQ